MLKVVQYTKPSGQVLRIIKQNYDSYHKILGIEIHHNNFEITTRNTWLAQPQFYYRRCINIDYYMQLKGRRR